MPTLKSIVDINLEIIITRTHSTQGPGMQPFPINGTDCGCHCAWFLLLLRKGQAKRKKQVVKMLPVNHQMKETSPPQKEISTLCPLSKFPQYPQKLTSVMISILGP